MCRASARQSMSSSRRCVISPSRSPYVDKSCKMAWSRNPIGDGSSRADSNTAAIWSGRKDRGDGLIGIEDRRDDVRRQIGGGVAGVVEISQEGAKLLGDVLERFAPEPRCPLLEVGIDIADAQVEDAVGARYMPGQEVPGLPHQGVDCFSRQPALDPQPRLIRAAYRPAGALAGIDRVGLRRPGSVLEPQ